MKKITILIPTNNINYLAETLDSISNQTLPASFFEVLIVLDRVKKETIEAMLSGLDFEVKTIQSSAPGIVNALNEGLKTITTEFVARIDADDIMLPSRLEEQLLEIERRNLVGLGTFMRLIDETGNIIGQTTYPSRSFFIKKILPYQNTFGHPTMLLRRSALEKVGLYRETKSEDWDLWIRLSEIGRLSNLRKPLTEYRIHGAQLSKNVVSNESELSGRFQYCRFLKNIGAKYEVNQQSEFEIYYTNRKAEKKIKQKKLILEKQIQNRIEAQKIMKNYNKNQKILRIKYLFMAFYVSPLEILLLILRRVNKIF